MKLNLIDPIGPAQLDGEIRRVRLHALVDTLSLKSWRDERAALSELKKLCLETVAGAGIIRFAENDHGSSIFIETERPRFFEVKDQHGELSYGAHLITSERSIQLTTEGSFLLNFPRQINGILLTASGENVGSEPLTVLPESLCKILLRAAHRRVVMMQRQAVPEIRMALMGHSSNSEMIEAVQRAIDRSGFYPLSAGGKEAWAPSLDSKGEPEKFVLQIRGFEVSVFKKESGMCGIEIKALSGLQSNKPFHRWHVELSADAAQLFQQLDGHDMARKAPLTPLRPIRVG